MALALGSRDASAEEPVSWVNLVGVTATGSTITKTAGVGWNAGAVSTKALVSGDGFIEFAAVETSTYRMAGFGRSDDNQGYADIDFAIELYGDGVYIYEAGAYRGGFGTFVAGDRFRVGVESGTVVKIRSVSTVESTSTVTWGVTP